MTLSLLIGWSQSCLGVYQLKIRRDSPALAPVTPDFIGEGVLSSDAEGVVLLAGDFITGLVNVNALEKVRGSCKYI